MRKVVVAFLLLYTLFVACKKDNAGNPVIPRGISAKIDGVPWVATNISHSTTDDHIEIISYDSVRPAPQIVFRINNFKKTGSYSIPQVNDSAFLWGGMLPSYVISGRISILSLNDTAVCGTFSLTDHNVFSFSNTIVSDGTFNVNYR